MTVISLKLHLGILQFFCVMESSKDLSVITLNWADKLHKIIFLQRNSPSIILSFVLSMINMRLLMMWPVKSQYCDMAIYCFTSEQ